MKFLWPKLRLSFGFDWSLFIVPSLLAIFGIAVIFSITFNTASRIAYDQIIYLILGLVAAVAISFYDYRVLKGLYLVLYIIGVLLLILVLFIGTSTFGATRWINLYIFQLQPSEVFKFVAIIFIAKFFSDWQEIEWRKVVWLIAAILGPMILILLQPDLGTTSVIFVTLLALLFASPIRKLYLILGLAALIALSPLGWHFLKPYQKNRVVAFINPAADPQGAGYNVSQSKIAIGSGGLWGRGLGKGSQSQLNFLPVAHTDFIFAGAAEATGFIGSTFLLGLLLFLMIRILAITRLARDDFGMYLSVGIGTIFLFQALVNIGMNMGIMPVTGIPLPFVSYGGSAQISNFLAIGILQSIYMRHKITF